MVFCGRKVPVRKISVVVAGHQHKTVFNNTHMTELNPLSPKKAELFLNRPKPDIRLLDSIKSDKREA